MKEELIYPTYRYVMGVIVILAAALTVFSLMCTSPILTFFVDDFKIDMAMAGYASTLHVIFMGIFMFIGPIIIGYIDIKNTQLIGLAIIAAGTGGMLIFIPLFVIAALFACALPETGPRKGMPLKFQWKEKKAE